VPLTKRFKKPKKDFAGAIPDVRTTTVEKFCLLLFFPLLTILKEEEVAIQQSSSSTR
jgi:hypothetical protein